MTRQSNSQVVSNNLTWARFCGVPIRLRIAELPLLQPQVYLGTPFFLLEAVLSFPQNQFSYNKLYKYYCAFC